jgi:hypothetical protein
MRRSHLVLCGLVGAIAVAVGCQATSTQRTFGGNGGEGGDTTTSSGTGKGGNSASSSTGDGGSINFTSSASGTGGGGASCETDPNVDDDKDGFTEAQGDCNDCDKNVNPGAIEVVSDDPKATPADEDCDGKVDNVLPTCDDNLALADTDGNNGARAIDLCQFALDGDKKWGVLESKYVRADGSAASPSSQFGILSDFGPNVKVQGGTRMLGLSSGHARLPSQPDACGSLTCMGNGAGTAPAGYPQNAPGCTINNKIYDDIGLQVKVRSPKNATGYSFNFKFYTFEYPEWVCTSYNDQFMAYVDPEPMGALNHNISFDKNKNPVSVNIGFFDVCDGCASGPGEMQGTGFNTWNDAGGTTWLVTQAPVTGGDTVTIRFAIWDTGDQAYDSTVLVDNFKWIANGGTVVVGTVPVPPPK